MNNFLFKALATTLRQQTTTCVLLKAELSTNNPGEKNNNKREKDEVSVKPVVSQSSGKRTILGKLSESKELSERVGFLASKSIRFTHGWNNLHVSVCKQAEHEFQLNAESGDYYCLKCNKNGNWNEFKMIAGQFNENIDCNFSQMGLLSRHLLKPIKPQRTIEHADLWRRSEPIKSLDNTQFKIMIRNSTLDVDFSRSTLERHDIRIVDSKVLLPVNNEYGELDELVLIDATDRDESSINRESIYGTESLRQDSHTLFVTDKIKNMLAINEMTKKPAIVVNSLSSLNCRVLGQLEKFESIIFMHKDTRLALSLAQAINHTRCYLTNYSRTPFESMVLKEDLWKIIEHEKFSLKNNAIIQFEELKESVYDRIINTRKYSGIKWKRFQMLNEILKGHRSGELTIFTGPTGSGKTTFLSEYSLDLTMQGLRTLWGSFEIQNHTLAKLMMTQFCGMNLFKNIHLFDSIAQQFSRLPIYFMNFHGQETVENVLKTMSNAVVLYDINHIIIDNLQFMIGSQFQNSFDKYNHQDQIIGAFRRFATNFNCHVTIVIHPKKEESDELLKISSILGSAKSSQEADNVMILQVSKSVKEDRSTFIKFIEVCKNRYDGELGKMAIRFDKEKLSFMTKKIYRGGQDEVTDKWKQLKREIDTDTATDTVAILNRSDDLTNSNNEIELDDSAIQLKNFPPIIK